MRKLLKNNFEIAAQDRLEEILFGLLIFTLKLKKFSHHTHDDKFGQMMN